LQISIVLVVAVRKNKQFQVLQKFALSHVVISDFFINRKIRSSELFKGWHNRKITFSFGKPFVLEGFELSFVEKRHTAETRSLIEEVKVSVVLRVVLLLLAAGSLSLFNRLLNGLRSSYRTHFLRAAFKVSRIMFLRLLLTRFLLNRDFKDAFGSSKIALGLARFHDGGFGHQIRYGGVKVLNLFFLMF
jgi:hypothetical protein